MLKKIHNQKAFIQAPTHGVGFTLIELLVVIAIIGILATLAVVGFQNARKKSRDTKRMVDLRQIKQAFQLFYDENNRYPDNANDGVSNSGEVLGDDNGPIETALSPHMANMPEDPLYDGSTGNDDYYYAYDPTHNTCQPVISINRFETQDAIDDWGGQDTSSGGDMNIDTAHYNYCFIE